MNPTPTNPGDRPAGTSARSNRQHFKLILQEEGTFAERWAMRVRLPQLRALAILTALTIVGITYALVALTPLRESVVPGYLSTETRNLQTDAWRTADSLASVLAVQSQYLDNLRSIMTGDLPPGAWMSATETPAEAASTPSTTPSTSSAALDGLKERVEEEDAFAIGLSGGLDNSGLWLSPVEGRVSSGWDPAIGHWGVDLVAPANSPVKAVGAGTVIFAGFTSGGGHTVMVQHPGDKMSVYMHNSRVEVHPGDRVEPGELLAFIGNSGDHSTGPHLHFEWWESGAAIDPALRISLQ